ncbi:NAD-binding protein [Clavulina sp. PMI_390]|nr:NAD-binding protein [Clavulina sp. PMI_390]
MHTVLPPAKILVTGASGFVGSHVARTLLEQGYGVVGTVRSSAKGDYLMDIFREYDGRFSYVIVEDMEVPNAFDEVVRDGGFEAINHVASPFHLHTNEPSEIIGPAVGGTLNILNSALHYGPTVKRIVITSSTVAILEPHPAPYTYTEADWNESSPRAVDELGAKASAVDKYMASKSLAERAAWSFISEHKDRVAFDVVAINPPFIFGPIIHDAKTPAQLNFSHAFFMEMVKQKQENLTPELTGFFHNHMSDVRTVALAHARALQVEEAGGKRFILSASPFCFQDVYDALNEAGVNDVPRGFPGSQTQRRLTDCPQDNSQAKKILGLEFNGLRDIALDTYDSLRERFPGRLWSGGANSDVAVYK